MKNSETTAIFNAVLLRPGLPEARGGVLIKKGRISRLLGEAEPPPPDAAKIDGRGSYLAPGFIDLHIHGGGGDDFLSEGSRRLDRILKFLPRFGVTSILPTIATPSGAELLELIQLLGPYYRGRQTGSLVLGINLEGPYLSIGKRGAQPLRFLRHPSKDELKEVLGEARGSIKIMTLAPELDGAIPLIRMLKRSGVIPAVGHTTADYETTRLAIRAGLSYATHLFNSYPPLHHRQPGAVGAILESPRVKAEFICDGVHLSPVIIRLLFRLKALEDLLLVTDGVAVLGRRIKKFSMGGREVVVDRNGARLPDGTLVGSMLPMNRALRNAVEFTGLSLPDALRLVTVNPARLLKIADRKGDLRPGMDADLVLMDRRCNVSRTIIAGKTVFERKTD
ncbi:MAG: N-acetylglucosamine-6-phosphate deacetylase [Candidatus Erginobacter occultus]|nr:N-acetylglucosamine-6-phosphate deacetylase [Candidatus Erginobacter occultus]